MFQATRTVFDVRKNRWIFVIASVLIFTLLYMVPVWTTPGDDILFHFSILPKWVFVLMIILALGNGLLIAMQSYIYDVSKVWSASEKVKESATALGILSTAFMSTIACAACYSFVFSLFGLGVTTFVVKYQAYIGLFALILTIWSLYYSARRVRNDCLACKVSTTPELRKVLKDSKQ